jgi:hypothetical protein
MAKKLQGALHPLGARAHARNNFVQGATVWRKTRAPAKRRIY